MSAIESAPRNGLEETLLLRVGGVLDLAERRFADLARGVVDDAAQRDFVARVQDDAKIREQVFHFLALVELRSAQHGDGDAALFQRRLDGLALQVGAVQDRHFAKPMALGVRAS